MDDIEISYCYSERQMSIYDKRCCLGWVIVYMSRRYFQGVGVKAITTTAKFKLAKQFLALLQQENIQKIPKLTLQKRKEVCVVLFVYVGNKKGESYKSTQLCQ